KKKKRRGFESEGSEEGLKVTAEAHDKQSVVTQRERKREKERKRERKREANNVSRNLLVVYILSALCLFRSSSSSRMPHSRRVLRFFLLFALSVFAMQREGAPPRRSRSLQQTPTGNSEWVTKQKKKKSNLRIIIIRAVCEPDSHTHTRTRTEVVPIAGCARFGSFSGGGEERNEEEAAAKDA
ncbi:hypothetical protein CAOG_009692, partial [Capsaspora owczarzaki ATCC 30864]